MCRGRVATERAVPIVEVERVVLIQVCDQDIETVLTVEVREQDVARKLRVGRDRDTRRQVVQQGSGPLQVRQRDRCWSRRQGFQLPLERLTLGPVFLVGQVIPEVLFPEVNQSPLQPGPLD